MKEIRFHPHALYKMGEREISADDVIEALQHPDEVVPVKRGRICALKRRGDYWLKVIVEEGRRQALVITTYVTRRR